MAIAGGPPSSPEIEIIYVDEPNRATFRLVGAFDADASPLLRRAIGPHLTAGRPIVVDCAHLRELAPEVLSALVTCGRLASAFDTPFEIRHLRVAFADARGGTLPNRGATAPGGRAAHGDRT